MYDQLEQAIDQIEYLARQLPNDKRVARIVELAVQNIREYIEEGYRMKTEVTTIGN